MTTGNASRTPLAALLQERFGEAPDVPGGAQPDVWHTLAGRGSVRAFADTAVPDALIDMLCALALCAPSKSDLQQRDVIIVRDPGQRAKLLGALPDSQGWVTGAPALLIFCGNNARQRAHHARHDLPFPNDHLDAFFNASVDAGIALATCVVAAEAAGLGCCPISTIRDAIDDVSVILGLPDHVFPVAGLALGYPAQAQSERSSRLGLSATVHIDQFDQAAQDDGVTAYDARRAAQQPYAKQRDPDRFGLAPAYTWSLDKARQYTVAQRTDFGAYIRRQGFKLD